MHGVRPGVPQCPAQTARHAVGYGKVLEVTEPSRMLVAVIDRLVVEKIEPGK